MGLFDSRPSQEQMDLAQWLHDMYSECDSNREECRCGWDQQQYWLIQASELTQFLIAQGMVK